MPETGLDGGMRGAYKRGPFGAGVLGGVLIEIVEKMGRDARTAARPA